MFTKKDVTHCLFDMDGLLLGEFRISSIILKNPRFFREEEICLKFSTWKY